MAKAKAKLGNVNTSTSKSDLEVMKKKVEITVGTLLDELHIDWRADHNMQETPMRVAKMLVDESFSGRYLPQPRITDFPNASNVDQLITTGPVDVKSTCSHHLQPIYGKAWVGVLPKPKGRIIGLSKFNRVVDYFARRPQIQEEMTAQITNFLQDVLKPAGIIVLIKARHFCVCARGVNQESLMSTTDARGVLRSQFSLKEEFFHSINLKLE